jgi:thiamine biosynthesis protein ThiS
MRVTVNGQPREVPDRASVEDLLTDLGLRGSPCAVEVNRRLIPKARHAAHRLEEGDTVEVVTLVGGG